LKKKINMDKELIKENLRIEDRELDIYNTKTYFYHLPEEQIAQTPLEPRDSSKLLVYHKENNELEHKHFYDVIDYLKPNDVLVINNTKVLPARLFATKDTGAKIEVLLLKRIDLKTWEVLVKPGKRAKIGTILKFNEKLSGKILDDTEFGGKIIEFIYEGTFETIIEEIGTMPLPPYIKEKLENQERYQTVYSKINGSSAAPTAGLHFTKELIEKIKAKGIKIVEVLLHVGLGTFRPVSEENILNHKMHTEYVEVNEESAKIINETKQNGGRVIAVGTTSIRVLESCTNEEGILIPQCKDTSIFIYPGYKFKMIDGVITNFHLPESTLIMLVSAFCGIKNTLNMYNEAVKQNYRFFSFGDATLLI